MEILAVSGSLLRGNQHRLKTASVHGHKFATREQARQAVMDWMAFYNHRRLHSSLGYLSPMQYEQRWYEAQRKKAA